MTKSDCQRQVVPEREGREKRGGRKRRRGRELTGRELELENRQTDRQTDRQTEKETDRDREINSS